VDRALLGTSGGTVSEDVFNDTDGGSDMGSGIAGWGYEGRTVADLVEFTRAMGAEWVVDVRLNPLSRKPGFSKRALATDLAAAALDRLTELGARDGAVLLCFEADTGQCHRAEVQRALLQANATV
jgi:uncharacterized protein (DUF488 family)